MFFFDKLKQKLKTCLKFKRKRKKRLLCDLTYIQFKSTKKRGLCSLKGQYKGRKGQLVKKPIKMGLLNKDNVAAIGLFSIEIPIAKLQI